MDDTTTSTPAGVASDYGSNAVARFCSLSYRYWREDKAREAWVLTGAIVILVLLTLLVQVGINQWNRYFFDALDRKAANELAVGAGLILGLAVAAAAVAVALVHCRMRLQLRWRQWLTRRLVGDWLADRRFYQLTIVGDDNLNPEGRIADDARFATEPLVDFAVGLLTAVLTAVAFVGILWSVAGAITITVGAAQWRIPGYMVIAAIVYSGIASVATVMIGRPLSRRVQEKNGNEQQFRYELTRVRESAESISLIGGDEDERRRLDESFSSLAAQWLGVIRYQASLTWIVNGNSVLAPAVPLLLGAPSYLAGTLSLGALMQVTTAFLQVQVALNWVVENSIQLAQWRASAVRVGELSIAFADLDQEIVEAAHGSVLLGDSPDEKLRIENLSIAQANGRVLIEGAEVAIEKGEKVLIKGESGTGKSTLIRAMAGLWPWGTGAILRPKNATIAFMPQRPYIPLGDLRRALEYPSNEITHSDDVFAEALEKCGLADLVTRLGEEQQWNRILSGGEQQRLAFARLLVNVPDIAIMDEATSALDELSQAKMMDFLHAELASTTVVSVGHRPSLETYHTRVIHLVRQEGEHAARAHDRPAGPLYVLRGFWRRFRQG